MSPALPHRHPPLHRVRRLATVVLLLSTALLPTTARAAPDIPTQRVQFRPGSSSATLQGHLKGREPDARDYLLRARAGQTMKVELQTSSTSTYFNVLPPNSEETLYASGLSGEQHWSGALPADGDYRIRVYLNRAASRQGKSANYTLKLAVH